MFVDPKNFLYLSSSQKKIVYDVDEYTTGENL